jgi:flagellar basal-body rod modification protein FlgD
VTTPITGTGSNSGAGGGVLAGKEILGKDDFLRILVTQLRNQDPLNPMEGTEFATQLAQFSSVEQLMQMGEQMARSTAATTELQLTAQTTLGASMVGRDVLLNSTTLTVEDGSESRVVVELPSAAKNLAIEILGPDGKTLRTETFKDVGSGRQTLMVDPGDLAAGEYSYRVTATNAENKAITAQTYTIGRVEGMAFRGGVISLRVNGTLVPMLDVVEVMATAGAATSLPTSQEQTTP